MYKRLEKLVLLFIFTRLYFTMIAYFLMDKQVYGILFVMIKTLLVLVNRNDFNQVTYWAKAASQTTNG